MQIQPRTNTLHANRTRTRPFGVTLIVLVVSSLLMPQDAASPELTTGAPSSKAQGLDSIRTASTFTDANWISMGGFPGANSSVYAAVVDGSGNLYIGGTFTAAGTALVDHVAKWDGSHWSVLGSGMNDAVLALAVSGNNLYVGGAFTTAGGVTANHIAKWDGSSWSALGSGMNANVYALAVSGSELYVGGSFTTAGGKVSTYITRAYLEQPTLSILRSATDVTLSWPTFYETFALQQNPNAANTNAWSNANYPLTTNGPTKTATVPITPTNHFFRLLGN